MSVYVGIEGFGTRFSVAVMADETGRITSATRGEPIAFHTTPRPDLRSTLHQLLKDLAAGAGLRMSGLTDAGICIGLGGVTFPYDAKIDLPSVFDEIPSVSREKLLCTGDAEIIFASHTQSEVGSLITCGMGSRTTFVTPAGHFHYGGWGPALGDEGSGYAMGRDALRTIGHQYDSDEPSGVLWEEVQRQLAEPYKPAKEWKEASIAWKRHVLKFRENHFDDLRPATFAFSHTITREQGLWAWRSIVSSLVIPLMKAWQEGDAAAREIVESNAKSLVDQYDRARARAGVRKPRLDRIVLYGGVITYNPTFRRLLETELSRRYGGPVSAIVAGSPGTLRPVLGALLFALGADRGRPRLPRRDIVERLMSDPRLAKWELKHD